jgi:L-threonylcarbamoyladenylate synthase
VERPKPGSIVSPDAAAIAMAGEALAAGELVGMPTETVYGLAGDATNGLAVAAIFEAKGRPSFNPLISHVADIGQARRHGVFDADAESLARAGLDTIALRAPSHPVAQALLRAAGRPLAAPSANRSGHVSPTTAEHVRAELDGKVAMILDGGACDVGLESTVVACLGGDVAVLRPGGVTRREIEAALGRPLAGRSGDGTLRSPGMLALHYAPNAKLHMNVTEPGPDDAVLTFGSSKFVDGAGNRSVMNLSPSGDLRQAAARLFAALRELDAQNPPAISVTPIPTDGLGEAINDRLRRAAAPRGRV